MDGNKKNVRLLVEYDGTAYHGFQTQEDPHLPTIQSKLEEAVWRICQEKVRVTGSGRTDAGTHALGQVINFQTSSRIPIDKLPKALNSALPRDIRIQEAEYVQTDFHACYDAVAKTYQYVIDNQPTPSVFRRCYAYHVPHDLDTAKMQKAAAALVGTHDFASFRTSGSSARTSVRTVFQLDVIASGSSITITIKADGFLYNMVRNIVGTLVEVGRGKRQPGCVADILKARDRTKAGPTAPAHGLYLLEVYYDDERLFGNA
ncbi:MAG: tRNA pseudouridine(38-40) synthase TruA [Firmicutes bacterium]|nr:tRNA pseudouridine(38-40) synthase TruA [Bacillota bacterium]